jgi:hypothetical protein
VPKGSKDTLLKIAVLTLSHIQLLLDRFFTLNVRKSVNSWDRVMFDSNIRIYVKFCIEILCPTFEFVILLTVGAFYVHDGIQGLLLRCRADVSRDFVSAVSRLIFDL